MILAFTLGCLFGSLVGLASLVEFDQWLISRHATFRSRATKRFRAYRASIPHHH